MTTENRFNLIDEPWIPVVDAGRVSLGQLFGTFKYRALGGSPIQKISITKLLLAIAQAAYTPSDEDGWRLLGPEGLAEKCLVYLKNMHECFWLYGEKPFLQMPKISAAKKKSCWVVWPDNATSDNKTILTGFQAEKPLTDADKALLIVSLMGFGMGGKKTDNSVVLSEGYQGKLSKKNKASTGKPGTSLGRSGSMHSFLLGEFLQQTVWLNIFTNEQIEEKFSFFREGVGVAPWEKMPEGEDCTTAVSLKNSLMGRLVPLSRFCLLCENEDKIHYSEGISYLAYQDGGIDPSLAIKFSGKKPTALCVDPEKRPWRSLTALLSFMSKSDKMGYECLQIECGITRARLLVETLGIWSGGIKVVNKSGEQYVSGMSDFVDSSILLSSENLGKAWYEQLKMEMGKLDSLSEVLFKATYNFFDYQQMKEKKRAVKACNLFWQLCEHQFLALCVACQNAKDAKAMRRIVFVPCVNKAYDTFCPKGTARQLDAWAKNRPNLKKYLS